MRVVVEGRVSSSIASRALSEELERLEVQRRRYAMAETATRDAKAAERARQNRSRLDEEIRALRSALLVLASDDEGSEDEGTRVFEGTGPSVGTGAGGGRRDHETHLCDLRGASAVDVQGRGGARLEAPLRWDDLDWDDDVRTTYQGHLGATEGGGVRAVEVTEPGVSSEHPRVEDDASLADPDMVRWWIVGAALAGATVATLVSLVVF